MLVWACFPGQHKKKWLKWKGSRNRSVCHLMICRVIAVQSRLHSSERGYSPDLCLFCNLIVFGRNQEDILIQKAYGARNCNSFIRQATSSRLMERISTRLSSSIRRVISAHVTGLLSCCQVPLDPPSPVLFLPTLGLPVGEMAGRSNLEAAVGQHQFLLDIFQEATPCSLQTSLRAEVLSHSMNGIWP